MGFVYYTFGSNTTTMLAYHSAAKLGVEAKLVPNPPGDPDCSLAVRIPKDKHELVEEKWLGDEVRWRVRIVE
jgi:hypothetical protein